MFDWKRLAPTRCYLCGDQIAAGEGDREHFIPRTLHKDGKLPNEPGRAEPLPSHTTCNRSTSRDEERMAITWATVRPDAGFGSAERWDRAMRALKRPQAARFRESFLANMEKLPNGQGARITIPNQTAEYVIAKMVRGVIYRDTGHVFGNHVRWFIRIVPLEDMLEFDGNLVEFPGALSAKYLVSPDSPDLSACFLALFNFHTVVAFTFPETAPIVGSDAEPVADACPLPWPRVVRANET